MVKSERLEAPIVDDDPRYREAGIVVARCSSCGWWHVDKGYGKSNLHIDFKSAYGLLKPLDLADISIPIADVRNYLAARYDARFQVDPYRFEETVASVFRDAGYRARVTNRSGDWEIDVFLDGSNDSLIGVQVKRWRIPSL